MLSTIRKNNCTASSGVCGVAMLKSCSQAIGISLKFYMGYIDIFVLHETLQHDPVVKNQ